MARKPVGPPADECVRPTTFARWEPFSHPYKPANSEWSQNKTARTPEQ